MLETNYQIKPYFQNRIPKFKTVFGKANPNFVKCLRTGKQYQLLVYNTEIKLGFYLLRIFPKNYYAVTNFVIAKELKL